MRVKTIKRFKDLKENKVRNIGDEFNVTKERYNEIINVGKFVEEVKATKKAADKKVADK